MKNILAVIVLVVAAIYCLRAIPTDVMGLDGQRQYHTEVE